MQARPTTSQEPGARPEPWVVILREKKEDWNSEDRHITWWEVSDVIGPFGSQLEAESFSQTASGTYIECEVFPLRMFRTWKASRS